MLGTGSYPAAASGKQRIFPCIGTITGSFLGIATIGIWMLTFMRDYRFDKFAATLAASSLGIIVLSVYIFRNSKK